MWVFLVVAGTRRRADPEQHKLVGHGRIHLHRRERL